MIREQHLAHDQMGTPNHKPRLRWTPSQIQLQILERLFEQDNGTPNKQHLKEIADELRQHGQIAETNIYNWFQNRKACAKRRHQQVGRRRRTHLNQAKGALQVSITNGESQVDTDADSPRQKRPRHDRGHTQNDSEDFVDVKGISIIRGNGSGNEQSPGQSDPHEWQQITVSSVLVQDDIKTKISFSSGGFDLHGFAQGATASSTVKIGDSSKPLQAVQNVNGEGILPGDSQAQIIPTSEGSPSLHPFQIEERYSLAGGPVPSMVESQKGPEKGLKEVLGGISTLWNLHSGMDPNTQLEDLLTASGSPENS